MIVKVFTPNGNGKIEFTKEELEKLLDEVYQDGKNSSSIWATPNYIQTITPSCNPHQYNATCSAR